MSSRRPMPPTQATLAGRIRRVSACAALLAGFLACGPEDVPPPPLEIEVAEVVQRDQPIEMEMVGETLGSSDIPIRARVEGVLTGMSFTEGRPVKKDQLLYTIDPEPFESAVVEAQGGLSETRTRLAKAKADLDRIRPLAEMRAVSQTDLDGAVARYEAALGALQSSEAQVQQAKIRLGYTRIHAPIDGRIGISEAKVGEFVGQPPNPVVLNFVSQTDPIRVRFAIDERTYLTLARRLSLRTNEEAPSKVGQGLILILADGTIHPFEGRAVAADAAVDPKTGTFTFEADFPNPEGLVLAGQFARVRATAEVKKDALLVPSRAVGELQGNFRIFVVGADGKVELRPVELGPTIANFRIVKSGVEPGERVALEIVKLRPGMTVTPKLVALTDSGVIVDPDKPGKAGAGGAEAGKAGESDDDNAEKAGA